eukprot:7786492-Pyramimonas_sp.AAC.1
MFVRPRVLEGAGLIFWHLLIISLLQRCFPPGPYPHVRAVKSRWDSAALALLGSALPMPRLGKRASGWP